VTAVDGMPAVDWDSLLPPHRAAGEERPVGPASCVDVLRLSAEHRLGVFADGRGRTYPVPLVGPAESPCRAAPGQGAAEALVELLADGDQTRGAFEVTAWRHRPIAGERAITVDQTNESVVVGDSAVVKWTVLSDEGPHPAPSLLRALEAAGFDGMPRPWGTVEWRPAPESPPRLVALVVDYLPGAVDGWTWAVDDIRSAVERDDLAQATSAARSVGELVAAFHRALAGTARHALPDETARWQTAAIADLERALDVTRADAHHLLTSHAPAIRAAFAGLPSADTAVMRVHGDLHVGQVLRHGLGDEPAYALTDFDGNPVAPAAERVGEQPAAVDVAGMAQSFTHAGVVVCRHHPDLDPTAVGRAAAASRAAFLDSHRAGLGEHAYVRDDRLLRPLALRQVCREFVYAATHLPRWSYVPEAALPLLLEDAR
jgi:maltokinase